MTGMNYEVRKISSNEGKAFIIEHHYSHGCHNGPMCWGLFDGDKLVGVLAFATPCSENVRASVFGVEYKQHITELHRLVVLDEYGKNTESYFIARVLRDFKTLRSDIWAVLSYADSTEGHVGTIYRATNAMFTGSTTRKRFYIDGDNRLRHPRQNGVNISHEAAKLLGWKRVTREGKYRYLFFLPNNKPHKKWMKHHLRLPVLPYPKGEE
jgi:hypothetical protein